MAGDRETIADEIERAMKGMSLLSGDELRKATHAFGKLAYVHSSEIIAALRSKDREDGAREMAPKLRTPLTDAEREFISEMAHEDDGRPDRWQNFDPDFRQKDIARLLRLGWAERRETNGYREYRWTPAGRAALEEQEGRDG